MRCASISNPTWIASRLFMAGRWEGIYQTRVWITPVTAHPDWLEIYDSIHAPTDYFFGTSFTYSPLYLAVLAPIFSQLSVAQLSFLMFGVNALCVAWVGAESMRLAGRTSNQEQLFVGLLFSCTVPAVYSAFLGQNVLLCLALLMISFRWVRSQTWWGQAVCALSWIAAVACKPWAVLLLPVLAFKRAWLPLLVTTVGLILAYGVLVPRLFPELDASYTEMSDALVRSASLAGNSMSVRTLLMRLDNPAWPRYLTSWSSLKLDYRLLAAEVGSLVVLGSAFAALLILRKPSLLVALLAGASLMIVPLGISWTHYLAFAFPAALLAAGGPFDARTRLRRPVRRGAAFLRNTRFSSPLHARPGLALARGTIAPSRVFCPVVCRTVASRHPASVRFVHGCPCSTRVEERSR